MTAWFAKVRDIFRDRPWGTALLLLLVGYGSTLLFDAWLSDDAYITFRVVDNVIHGRALSTTSASGFRPTPTR